MHALDRHWTPYRHAAGTVGARRDTARLSACVCARTHTHGPARQLSAFFLFFQFVWAARTHMVRACSDLRVTSRHLRASETRGAGLAGAGIGMQHQYGQSMGGYYASQRWVPSCSPAPLPPCPYPPLLRSGGLPRSQAVRAAMVRARRGAVVNRAAAASKTGCSSSSSSRRRRRSTRHRSTRRCSTGSTCSSSTAGRSMGSSTPTSTRCARRCQRCVLRVGHTPAVCTPQHTGAKQALPARALARVVAQASLLSCRVLHARPRFPVVRLPAAGAHAPRAPP